MKRIGRQEHGRQPCRIRIGRLQIKAQQQLRIDRLLSRRWHRLRLWLDERWSGRQSEPCGERQYCKSEQTDPATRRDKRKDKERGEPHLKLCKQWNEWQSERKLKPRKRRSERHNNPRKRRICRALGFGIFVLCLTLTSCGFYDPARVRYCTELGLDPSAIGVRVSATINGQVYSQDAKSITEAIDAIGQAAGGRLFFKTVRIYILSPSLSRDTVLDFFDFALRERETMLKSRVLCAGEASAEELQHALLRDSSAVEHISAERFGCNRLLCVLSRASEGLEPVILRQLVHGEDGRAVPSGLAIYSPSGEFSGSVSGMAEMGIALANDSADGIAVTAGGFGAVLERARCKLSLSDGILTISLRGSFTVKEVSPGREDDAEAAISEQLTKCMQTALELGEEYGDVCGINAFLFRRRIDEAPREIRINSDFSMRGSGLKRIGEQNG